MAKRGLWRIAALAGAGMAAFLNPAMAQSGGIDIPREEPPARGPAETDPKERGAPRSGAIDLRPRFEKGQKLRYKLEMRNTSEVIEGADRRNGGAGEEMEGEELTRSDIEFGLLFSVNDVNDAGEATVDIVIERIRFKIDGPELTAEYDSTRPLSAGDDDLMVMVLRSLVGTTMTATIDRTGNIKRITGGEQLSALGQMGMPGAGGGGSSGGAGGGAGGLFGPIFSPKSGSGFARIGESWENEDVIDSGLLGKFRMNTRHTLQRMQGRDAIVDVRGVYRQDSEGEGGGAGLARIKDSRYSGNYTWDTSAGALKQMNTSMVTRAEQRVGEEMRELKSESAVKVTREK